MEHNERPAQYMQNFTLCFLLLFIVLNLFANAIAHPDSRTQLFSSICFVDNTLRNILDCGFISGNCPNINMNRMNMDLLCNHLYKSADCMGYSTVYDTHLLIKYSFLYRHHQLLSSSIIIIVIANIIWCA